MEEKRRLNLQKKHEEDLQRIKGFRLLDDDFMNKVFEDKECTEFLLRVILDRDDLEVLEVHGQYMIKNLQGRSVKLDILAVDSGGKIYNVEIQRSDKEASVKRARYNSSLIDANITEPGKKYENLGEVYMIFVTEHDVLKRGLPIYHIDRTIMETGEPFGDESHIIYVNSQVKDETALGKLMQDFYCTDPAEMHSEVLANRVRYFKEDERGVAVMCRVMEQMREEAMAEGIEIGRSEGIELGRSEGIELGRSEGIELGRSEGRFKTILTFLMNGGTQDDAKKLLGVTEEEIKAAEEMLYAC